MENLAYRERDRFEIIDGKVVMMSPRPATNHGVVAGNIYHIFRDYLKGKNVELLWMATIFTSTKKIP